MPMGTLKAEYVASSHSVMTSVAFTILLVRGSSRCNPQMDEDLQQSQLNFSCVQLDDMVMLQFIRQGNV